MPEKVIQIAFSSDEHISAKRREDTRNSLLWMAEHMAKRGVDYYFSCGDLYDKVATEEDFKVTAEFISKSHIKPVFLAGNHGTHKALEVIQHMSTFRKEKPEVIFKPGIYSYNRTNMGQLSAITAYAIPHLDKAHVQLIQECVGVSEGQMLFNDLVKKVFDWMIADSAQRTGVKVFLGHFTVNGARVSTGQELNDPGLSQGFIVPPAWLSKLSCQVKAIGHIHKAQHIGDPADNIIHVGSLSRCNFSEIEDKGYRIATFDSQTGELLEFEFIKNPHAPLLVTEEAVWNQGAREWEITGETNHLEGAEVRVIARYQEDETPDFLHLQKEYKEFKMAAPLTIKRNVVPVVRTRAAEVAQAETAIDKLKAYWQKVESPADEHREEIIAIVERIEGGLLNANR